MALLYRTDGWVKDALGNAVPGAQVYICQQPANTISLPPSPLATIYSDNAGLVPVDQPILTDGFGHYDFYAAPQIATLVVGLAGRTSQVYPDQSVGGVGPNSQALVAGENITIVGSVISAVIPPAGSVILRTNGVNNADQDILNLHSSDASISLVADGAGGVDFTVLTSPSQLAVKTGGTNNSDQTVLNHTSSDGSLLVTNPSGGIENFGLLQFLESSPGFTLSGDGGYYRQDGGATGRFGTGTANQVIFWTVIKLYPWTVKTIYYRINANLASSHSAFGIYNADGSTLLAAWNNFDTSVGAGNYSQTISNAVTLPPGIYLMATGCDHTGTAPGIQGGYATLGSSESTAPWNQGSIIRSGLAGNAMSGGSLPSSIGSRSLVAFPLDVPCIMIEPA